MSEMIERGARAIARSLEVPEDSWRDHVDEARAVIEALRKPTEAMIDSVYQISEIDAIRDRDIPIVWEAMIDAALI